MGRVVRELRGHTDTITNLAWGSDSRQIIRITQTLRIFCCVGCWCQEGERVLCEFGTQLVPRVQMSWLPLVLGPVHRSTLIFNFSNIIAILISTGGWAGMDRHEQCVGHCCGKSIRSLTGTHFLRGY